MKRARSFHYLRKAGRGAIDDWAIAPMANGSNRNIDCATLTNMEVSSRKD